LVNSSAPKAACTTRQTSSSAKLSASAATIEVSANTTSPTRRERIRPRMSPARPASACTERLVTT
jgi:hypothetical protein